MTTKESWPTGVQIEQLRKLAATRQVVEGEAVTRAERWAAVERVLMTCTRTEADVLIRQLRRMPIQPAWHERTPEFDRRHRSLVARCQGRPDPVQAEAWFHRFVGRRGWLSKADTREPVVPGPEAVAEAKALLAGGAKIKRPTAAELKEWYATRQTREDEVFGEVMIGNWD